MKVIAINGSARKNGNTSILIHKVFEPLKNEGIHCEEIQLAGKTIEGCKACYTCFTTKDKRCSNNHDIINDCIAKMTEADAIILGSPVYVADVSSQLKALIDRACLVSKANDNMFRRKIGAGVIAVRRGGATNAFDTINHFFTISEMIIVGSSYWNFAFGREIGEVNGDEEGLRTMKTLGENMVWLLKKTAK